MCAETLMWPTTHLQPGPIRPTASAPSSPNRARHRRTVLGVAIAQIRRPDTEGHAYYQRCLQRGKTKREATRALKRRISDRIWTHSPTHKPIPALDIEAHPPAPPLAKPATTPTHHPRQQHD